MGPPVIVQAISSRLATIRARLTLWYVALLSTVLVVFSAFLYLRLAQNLRGETDRALLLEARQAGATLDLNGSPPFLHDALERLPPGMVIALYSPNGAPLESSVPGNAPPHLPPPGPSVPGNGTTIATVRLPGGDWRVATAAVTDHGAARGFVQVAEPEEPAETALHQLALLMGLGVPLTIVLASAGGLFLAGRALDPIDRITRTAQRINAEDLSQRLALPPGGDEVARLAATFDAMLDRIGAAFARERQFTADASHELRTPLAVVTARAELALSRARRPAEYREALAEIHTEAQRLNRLLGELMVLARADRDDDLMEREPLDLAVLVSDTVATLAPLADAAGIALRVAPCAETPTRGDQARLTQLVVNLVDNALRYTPRGGAVDVGVGRDDDRAVLTVRDTGVGIAPEHLPRIFERFYRADAARSRTDGGAGLGLAIVAWIVRAHDGAITANSAPGKGTTFTVWLPLMEESMAKARAR